MNGERLTDRPGGLEKRTWILAAVICAVLLGVSAVMFIPVKSKMNETLPAVMLSRESGETQVTTLTLNGTWAQQRMGKSAMTYKGLSLALWGPPRWRTPCGTAWMSKACCCMKAPTAGI